ncbi:MAG TPA: UpxY family transcription antiterminator [Bryobacteraceae bacterium]|nr:UpxY family transcription antiterminator [Bryobacteraceae bacterium]
MISGQAAGLEEAGEQAVAHPWFAVRVKSNCEKVAELHLADRGYERFAPSYKVERQWSDRKKTIDQFLFPGYVFCRLDPHDRLPVLSVPGVVGLVGFGRIPAPIPDEEIERIQRMVQSGLLVKPWPFLEVGQTVLIERGPLAGMEGILADEKGQCRLVVSVNLLQRSVAAEVERTSVRPVPSRLNRTCGALSPAERQ